MARKSQRLSAGTASIAPSAHKRAASNTSLPGTDTKKSKTKATPTKSQYFSKAGREQHQDLSEDDANDDEDEDFSSAPEDDLSTYGSAADSENEDDDDDDNDEEYESEIEEPKSRRKSTSKKSGAVTSTKSSGGGELWREGVKTGFGPGQQVIIKKPKARPAGKVPYSDDTIHPNTLLFLKDLKGNNNREWLKSEYRPFSALSLFRSVHVHHNLVATLKPSARCLISLHGSERCPYGCTNYQTSRLHKGELRAIEFLHPASLVP